MVRVPTINGMAPVAFRGEAVVFAQLPNHVDWSSASTDKTQLKLSLAEAQQELELITKKLDAFDHTNGDPKSAVEMLATQKQVKSRLEDLQKQLKALEGRQWSDYLAIQQTMELHWGLNSIDDRLYELRPAAHKPEIKEMQHLFTCTGLNQTSTSTSTSEGQDVKDQDTVVIPMKDLVRMYRCSNHVTCLFRQQQNRWSSFSNTSSCPMMMHRLRTLYLEVTVGSMWLQGVIISTCTRNLGTYWERSV